MQKTEIERDLGVLISNDLECDQHVISATSKANRKLGMIKHTLKYPDTNTLKLLNKSMVRPHLEYAATVWNPTWQKDIDKLENVQRRATKIEPLKGKNYEERSRILDLPLLQERRRRGDLIEMYKTVNSNGYINLIEPLRFFDNMSRGHHSKRIHWELVKKRCRYHFSQTEW